NGSSRAATGCCRGSAKAGWAPCGGPSTRPCTGRSPSRRYGPRPDWGPGTSHACTAAWSGRRGRPPAYPTAMWSPSTTWSWRTNGPGS
ncbi:serine/threonine protein kinase, partial [Streptomyces sp. Mg1]